MPIVRNAVFRAMPVTMPGRAIGRMTRNDTVSRPKNRKRWTAKASSDPSTSATTVAPSAARSEFRSAVRTPSFVERLEVPVDRQSLGWPLRDEPGVERVQDDDADRQVDEGEREAGGDPERDARRSRAHRHMRLECAEASGHGEVDDHDRHGHECVRGGQRLVDRDVAVDDVADELAARHERRDDVVAEGQREREDRAGDDRGQGQRQDDPAERLAGPGTEVSRTPRAASPGCARVRRRWAGSCTAATGS